MPEAAPDPRKANLAFRMLRFVGRGLFRALFHVDVDGLERLPAAGGYVLACNHLSWLDPLLLLAYLPAQPRMHFLAAAEYTVAGPWAVRQIVRLVGGVIPIDRESHKGDRAAVVQALRVLRGGGVLGIFPEGWCGEVEGQIQPLKEGAATFATRTGSPIVVVGLSGTFALCFRRRIRVRVGEVLAPGAQESQGELLERVAVAMARAVPPLHPDQPKRKYLAWLSQMF